MGLAFCFCTDAAAMLRKKKTDKEPKKEIVQPVPADSFSYAMGVAQCEGLKQYLQRREGVDSAFIQDAAAGILAFTNMKDDEVQKVLAFVAGFRIGQMNKTQVIPTLNEQATGKKDTAYVSMAAFHQGLHDGLLDQAKVSPEQAMQLADRQMKYYTTQLKEANQAWLADNQKKKGVKTTKSGLQYRVLSQGEGPVATDSSEVEVHYEGRLIDGRVFDSSYQRNESTKFRCDQVIKGWTEALKIMPEGSVWELYIPSELAYGERGTQGIPPYSTLIFKVELLKTTKAADKK